MCNCASCGVEMLGSCEREWALSLPLAERANWPQLVAGRIRDRPYCMGCYRVRRPSFGYLTGRRFGRILEDGGNGFDNAVRALEDGV